MLCGFISVKKTMDAIFIAYQLLEKIIEEIQDMYCYFADLEKRAIVPRILNKWCWREEQLKMVNLLGLNDEN